jgi:hypothetical protein
LITTNLSAHFAVNPSPAVTAKGRLFVMLPGTGAVPRFYRQIVRVGAARGYHAIGLTYPNDTAIGDLCGTTAPADCSALARREVITGTDTSGVVSVDSNNAINGRLIVLLTYLNSTYPAEGWGQYLIGGAPDWSRITVAGHSQGAGHAAFIGKISSVNRVVVFSGPADVSASGVAPWLGQAGLTPASRYYGFTHTGDTLVPIALALAAWSALGMNANTPPTDVGTTTAPYGNAQQLITSAPPNPAAPTTSPEHGATIADAVTPLNAQGGFVFQPVWEYLAFP